MKDWERAPQCDRSPTGSMMGQVRGQHPSLQGECASLAPEQWGHRARARSWWAHLRNGSWGTGTAPPQPRKIKIFWSAQFYFSKRLPSLREPLVKTLLYLVHSPPLSPA